MTEETETPAWRIIVRNAKAPFLVSGRKKKTWESMRHTSACQILKCFLTTWRVLGSPNPQWKAWFTTIVAKKEGELFILSPSQVYFFTLQMDKSSFRTKYSYSYPSTNHHQHLQVENPSKKAPDPSLKRTFQASHLEKQFYQVNEMTAVLRLFFCPRSRHVAHFFSFNGCLSKLRSMGSGREIDRISGSHAGSLFPLRKHMTRGTNHSFPYFYLASLGTWNEWNVEG